MEKKRDIGLADTMAKKKGAREDTCNPYTV